MSDVIQDLYEVILSRRESADEDSYTAYLFREGIDKILKKVGEESAETIIAAKSLEAARANRPDSQDSFADARRDDLVNEVADLIYHVLVMLAERNVPWSDVEGIFAERAGKAGNLKKSRNAANDR